MLTEVLNRIKAVIHGKLNSSSDSLNNSQHFMKSENLPPSSLVAVLSPLNSFRAVPVT